MVGCGPLWTIDLKHYKPDSDKDDCENKKPKINANVTVHAKANDDIDGSVSGALQAIVSIQGATDNGNINVKK